MTEKIYEISVLKGDGIGPEVVDEAVWTRVREGVMETVRAALVDLDRMRAREGEILKRDLDERAMEMASS